MALAAGLAAGAGLVPVPLLQSDPVLVVAQRTELKWSATGRSLGWLASGARAERLGGRDGWTRLEVRGWMPRAALATSESGARVVPFEETLRATPAERPFGALREDVSVRIVARTEGWAEVAVIGWVPDSAVVTAPGEAAPVVAEPTATTRPPDVVATRPTAIGRLAQRVELRGAPEGAPLTQLPTGSLVTILETRGAWTRIAVQGWVPSGAIEAGRNEDVGPAVVAAADPDVFVGRRMRWTLEHVALQRADSLRPEFEPGEFFALARVPGEAGLYVYLVIPSELVPRFRSLAPFGLVRVEGRVRTGRSALTGNAILEVDRLLP